MRRLTAPPTTNVPAIATRDRQCKPGERQRRSTAGSRRKRAAPHHDGDGRRRENRNREHQDLAEDKRPEDVCRSHRRTCWWPHERRLRRHASGCRDSGGTILGGRSTFLRTGRGAGSSGAALNRVRSSSSSSASSAGAASGRTNNGADSDADREPLASGTSRVASSSTSSNAAASAGFNGRRSWRRCREPSG